MIFKIKAAGYLLSVILITALSPSCSEYNKTDQLQVKWSSRNVYNIPYRLRLQKFDEKNLIQNAGFEVGKYYEFNAKSRPFDVLNWKKTSDYVEWVDVQNTTLYDSLEVNSGKHAIKIIKPLADETEEKGEGILSEFIKVIPGKYQLNLHVRLENIKSAKARLGTRLYDAIDIRLIYFDKNKLEINPNMYSRFHQSHINTSFKGYSFSNFNEIDSLGWTEVFCESAYPPFPNGYIPDNARFVKVFLGLKGSGTLWADDIRLIYTEDNFSLTEKLAPFFEQSFDRYDLLTPAPKSIQKLDKTTLKTNTDSAIRIAVVEPQQKTPSEVKELLQKQLKKYTIAYYKSLTEKQAEGYSLVIETTSTLKPLASDSSFKAIQHKGDEAYSILCSDRSEYVVKISANSSSGFYHAFATLIKLIDTTDNVFYRANIIDWPTYAFRNIILPDNDSGVPGVNDLLKMGYSNVFISSPASEVFSVTSQPDRKNGYYEISNQKNSIKNLKGLSKQLKKHTLDNLLLEENIPPQQMLHDTYEQLHRNFYDNITQKGTSTQVFYRPEWNSLYTIDKHRSITERFIYHNNEPLQQFDFFVWAGNASETSIVDNLDLFRMKDLLPMPLTFIQSIFPFTLQNDSLFILEEYMPKFTGNPAGISNMQFIAPEYNSPFINLVVICAADYLWNPDSYVSEFSLFKALNSQFNRSDAISIIQYSTLVIQLKQIIIDKKMTHTINKWTRQEQNIISELSSVLKDIQNGESITMDVKTHVTMTYNKLQQYFP